MRFPWNVSVKGATVEITAVWLYTLVVKVMDIATATMCFFYIQNVLNVWTEGIATLPLRCVTAIQNLMDQIAVSLCTFRATCYSVKLHAPSCLACGTGCRNGATYNSTTDQCDCAPGNSGPSCGEYRISVSHMSGYTIGRICTCMHVCETKCHISVYGIESGI